MIEYFDEAKSRAINLGQDSCSLEEWKKGGYKKYSCSWHPNKFLVFLHPDELVGSDEYATEDPYAVSDHMTSNFHRRRFNCTLDLLKGVQGKGLKLLDIACGEGHITAEIKKHFPKMEVLGLDYSTSAIDYAHKKYKGVTFFVADAHQLPFKDESLDIAICNNIWEHVPDPLAMLKAISRVLKPGGLLIISTPSRYRFSNLARIARGKGVGFMSSYHVTEYSVGQVKEQLKYGGFQVKKITSTTIAERSPLSRLAKSFISLILKLTKSDHILESTAFYLAVKTSQSK
ncbi:hypothetical protein A3A71_00580 [Candidatus Berkelbacteria bacterium RIFCSPLOWO2_01_FULL_50_28]|uniref:Methyltransferase domain-containing protein n=1 Tax=Candidatus Berkelbacteria bacterium RIFCSPLOWO2_01_FULL_50_28 TaxID=1797471 RepID=A0A1F5EAW3_9BACT|nr:MAG: hypothetical protein A2807_00320 [Candidatus Berkelbacteria bacterium RIFCSPHIGHO2_01_FULL_50_36]OGD63857.1 MAG: hypothetical protein A3F39_03395 [Candidatus Berkelbacteria bacterium RIFCSPHIGHO2_12_FULL_50_11]OGD64538.1 MAG: hypothetical protein A3A71_00580 [Candidatus Berkelbacteria bacterium RIFCSPLOWO2_01_FULL_50_28]